MKFVSFELALLFLIYETYFCLVTGKTIKEKSDCTKLLNFINGDSKDYGDSCCTGITTICDKEGYITHTVGPDADLTSFPYLSRIEEINLLHNNLKEIPESILKLTTLKTLELRYNQIEVIPPAIQNLSQLENLNLWENKIKELPNELFKLKNLKKLSLSYNQIEVIPPAIQNLSQLENLDFSNNNVKELPKEFFNLTNLKYLGAGSNDIEVIQPDIENLSKLEWLFLGANNIKKLPKEIFNLTNLNILDFADNPGLVTKVIKKSDNSTITNCSFNNVDILCYEPQACLSIKVNNNSYSDANATKQLKICTKEEIDEF